MSNNPFLPEPNQPSYSAAERFPDINAPTPYPVPAQQTPYPYGGQTGTPSFQPQSTGAPAFQQQPAGFYNPPNLQQQNSYGFGAAGPQYQQSQPQFGQASPYGLPQGLQQQQPGVNPGYMNQHAQQQQWGQGQYGGLVQSGFHNPSNPIATFDPLAPQSSQQQPQLQSQQSFQGAPSQLQSPIISASTVSQSKGGSHPQYGEHPRDFVRSNKKELETWSANAWQRLIDRCIALKNAWESRKTTLQQYSTSPVAVQFGGIDFQQLMKDCDTQIDLIEASRFQLVEAQLGYRHSSDPASKSRVREAINAGLQALPGWPQSPDELRNSLQASIPVAPQPQQQWGGGQVWAGQSPLPTGVPGVQGWGAPSGQWGQGANQWAPPGAGYGTPGWR